MKVDRLALRLYNRGLKDLARLVAVRSEGPSVKRVQGRGLLTIAVLLVFLASQLAMAQVLTRATPPESVETLPVAAGAGDQEASVVPEPMPVPVRTLPAEPTARPEEPDWRVLEARALPTGTPESVGMDGRALARIDDFVRGQINKGAFPGAVVLVARQGVVVKHTAYGQAAVYAAAGEKLEEPIPTQPDTIYDLASLTKLFAATAALALVDRGELELDAPVARYLPEFGVKGKETVTIRQLLTHTSGLPEGLRLWTRGEDPEECLASAYQVQLTSAPGVKRVYSDAGPIIVGKVVERITGLGLDEFLERTVLAPLGLADTMYLPPPSLAPRIAPTEILPSGRHGVYWGQVHDGEARTLGGVAGNAGLFGTASDLAVFAQMMLDGGAYDGASVLSPTTISAALRPQLPNTRTQALGWELNQRWYMGNLASATTFGHTGFTGTSLVVSPREQVIVVLLTNRLHPKSGGSTNEARAGVANLVHAALRN